MSEQTPGQRTINIMNKLLDKIEENIDVPGDSDQTLSVKHHRRELYLKSYLTLCEAERHRNASLERR